MIGARFSGSTRSGGASTVDFCIAPVVGTVIFSQGARSIFSWPRCTCALPLETTNSLSFFCGSDLTAALLLECSCAVASSALTAALESGELQFGVLKSTCPTLMCTATLVGLLL